jgi:hypothetical protein
MKISFTYKQDKDVWCLLNKGKSSNNSPNPTKVYELLVAEYGNNPNETDAVSFINSYFAKHAVSVEMYIQQYKADWEIIADEYHERAKKVFGIDLPTDITAYLTINNRNPYSIMNNMFYVSLPRDSVRKTVLHELWHFYTWYGLGADQESKLGKEKYNELKEALTVLLNVECSDLFPDGVTDEGYPQHQALRQQILELWDVHKNINKVWNQIQ